MKNVTTIFCERIKKLRNGKSQDEVAKEIGISRGALSYYENGNRNPDINVLYTLSKYYNVSADYLLGLSDVPNCSPEEQAISNELGISINLIKYLKENARNADSMPLKDDYEALQHSIWALLYEQAINILLYENNEVMHDIAAYIFTDFTHFTDFYDDNDYYHHIGGLELIDSRLSAIYGDDYDFFSNAILLKIQNGLVAIREKYRNKLDSEIPILSESPIEYHRLEELQNLFKKISTESLPFE